MTRQDFKDLVWVVICTILIVGLVTFGVVIAFGWKIFLAFFGFITAFFAFCAALHYISMTANYVIDKIYDRYISKRETSDGKD